MFHEWAFFMVQGKYWVNHNSQEIKIMNHEFPPHCFSMLGQAYCLLKHTAWSVLSPLHLCIGGESMGHGLYCLHSTNTIGGESLGHGLFSRQACCSTTSDGWLCAPHSQGWHLCLLNRHTQIQGYYSHAWRKDFTLLRREVTPHHKIKTQLN